MSKSTGETVNPLELVEQYGADAFRYFVMREMTVGRDAEFSLERFESRYRADLGNDLGNLLSRLLHMLERYCGGLVPEIPVRGKPEENLSLLWEETKDRVMNDFSGYRFNQALDHLFGFFRSINKYAD